MTPLTKFAPPTPSEAAAGEFTEERFEFKNCFAARGKKKKETPSQKRGRKRLEMASDLSEVVRKYGLDW